MLLRVRRYLSANKDIPFKTPLGSMAQTQNKNQKNLTHEKPVPATVLPNNLDTD
jgi:hypothetical protein